MHSHNRCLQHSGYGFDMHCYLRLLSSLGFWPVFPCSITEHYTRARTSRDLHLEKQLPRGGKTGREIVEWHVKMAYGDYIQTCMFWGQEKWRYSPGTMLQNLFLYIHAQTQQFMVYHLITCVQWNKSNSTEISIQSLKF